MLKLRPYQIDCLNYLKKWNGRVLIGDVMGSGKTAESLSWLADNPNHLPALVICPATIKEQWKQQWKMWLGKPHVKVLHGITPTKLNKDISYILNWDILHYWSHYLPIRSIKTIIADEVQRAGNFKAKRTKALSYLAKYPPYFLPMSGTPIRTRPGQFFPILHMLDPGMFPSLNEFQKRYCNMKYNPWTGRFEEKPGGKNLEELNLILSDYMIRREKRDILTDLPPKQKIIVPLEIENQNEYETLELITKDEINETNWKQQIEKLRNSAFHFKQNNVIAWLTDFLDSGESIIVFAYHHSVMDLLQSHFKNISVKVDGSVIGGAREQALKLFKSGGKQMLIAQIEAMGIGVDGLQDVCSNCAFVEFGLSASDHEQAEGRLERSGQSNGVNSYYLIGEGTIDEKVMKVLDSQTKMFDLLVRGQVTEQKDLLTELYKIWR